MVWAKTISCVWVALPLEGRIRTSQLIVHIFKTAYYLKHGLRISKRFFEVAWCLTVTGLTLSLGCCGVSDVLQGFP